MSFIDLDNHLGFIHVHKTGGMSIEMAWQKRETRLLILAAHDPAHYVQNAWPKEWNESYKVGFVRNPWDWWVSAYHWYDFIKEYTSFREFLLNHEKSLAKFPLRCQWPMVCDTQGRLLVDCIYHYESLEADYQAMCERVHVPVIPLERRHATKHCPYRQYYDEQLIEIVRKISGRDIELFGYEF